MDRNFKTGDIVRHFKYETLSQEEKDNLMYIYEIIGTAHHTETEEQLMVYRALYDRNKVCARPLQMFVSEVDHEKYPNIKQKYRFEVVEGSNKEPEKPVKKNLSKIEILENGILKLDTEAVVNAANSNLLQGGGVCGVLFNAAGAAKLQEACDEIGHCDTGKAVITPAFNFRDAKYIIHAVGPVWRGGNNDEANLLYGAYYSSLELAKEKGLKSIGFPLISAGIYGYPAEEAFAVAIKACKEFIANNQDYDIVIKFGVPEESKRIIGKNVLAEYER